MRHVLVRYSGPIDWDFWKPCFPDLMTMCEDIERETRRLHDGDIVLMMEAPEKMAITSIGIDAAKRWSDTTIVYCGGPWRIA